MSISIIVLIKKKKKITIRQLFLFFGVIFDPLSMIG